MDLVERGLAFGEPKRATQSRLGGVVSHRRETWKKDHIFLWKTSPEFVVPDLSYDYSWVLRPAYYFVMSQSCRIEFEIFHSERKAHAKKKNWVQKKITQKM